MYTLRLALVLCCCWLLRPAMHAQIEADAKAILTKSCETYRQLKSYHFVHELMLDAKKPGDPALKTVARIPMEIASEKIREEDIPLLPLNADRFRFDAQGEKGLSIVIGDGRATLLSREKQEYMQGTSLHSISTSVGGSMMLCLFLNPFEILKEQGIRLARKVRPEKVQIDKEEHLCHVIEGTLVKLDRSRKIPEDPVLDFAFQLTLLGAFLPKEYAGLYNTDGTEGIKFKLWIDQQSHLMLKSQITASVELSRNVIEKTITLEVQLTDQFSKVMTNKEVPVELFSFKPPAGAKKVPNVRDPK